MSTNIFKQTINKRLAESDEWPVNKKKSRNEQKINT